MNPQYVLKLLLASASILFVGCGADKSTDQAVEDIAYAVEPQVSLRDRCTAKQQSRLESCEMADEATRGECTAAASALLEACSDLPSLVMVAGETENTGLCDGTCSTVPCTVSKPCNLGKDVDGDGKIDRCVTGEICAPGVSGTVCDTGVLFDCYCTNVYRPSGIIRPLDECAVQCD